MNEKDTFPRHHVCITVLMKTSPNTDFFLTWIDKKIKHEFIHLNQLRERYMKRLESGIQVASLGPAWDYLKISYFPLKYK